MVLSRRNSRNLLTKRKARQTSRNVTNATRKGSRSGTVMRNTANIVECPRRASLELGYTTKRLLKINEASHLLHTKNKMAAPVAAQQQRINNEATTSRQIEHTAPAHGARQGVRWKLLEKRVLCHVTGRPLQPSVAQCPVAKSGQEWLVRSVSPSQSRAHEWWRARIVGTRAWTLDLIKDVWSLGKGNRSTSVPSKTHRTAPAPGQWSAGNHPNCARGVGMERPLGRRRGPVREESGATPKMHT